MSILITGGAGFIGSRLALALRKQGERLILLDNFNSYYDPKLKRANAALFAADPRVTVVEGDVRDLALVDGLVGEHQVHKIAHLAAMAGVRNSMNEAHLYFEVNLMGSLNMMEVARKYGIKQFIQASTSSVYGETTRLPFVEADAADRPLAPYPASKRAAEIMAHSYHHLFGLNITCLRFFNVYGPQGRPDMMPMKVLDAAANGTPVTLFNGGQLGRDWTYIDDIVDGVMAALEHPLGYEVMNLGCGNPITMNEFVDIIEELSSTKIQRIDAPAPPSEPPITFCDNSRARQLLGFEPKVNVVDGLARTYEWYANGRERQ
ncbi:MAG: SDR family NAD(P)-dependent oxidoreductase [Anaerolineae bacterium]|nr:SDR family NAD(P)-dependent oxidoreductase [Anaerolineae bacterium]